MNTSGWLYNLGDSTPQRWVIERYIELGGHLITLGSDSHRAVNVGSYISKAIGVLKELAVKQVFYAENGCYVPFNIQEMV
jgi:histidinol-phosphatase (PHP family)